MKTHIYLIIALCCNIFTGFSQESTLETLPKALNDIPYVFKGEMTGVEYYFGDSLGNRLPQGVFHLKNGEIGIAYSSATINVCQVFKGGDKLKPGTIELVTSAPRYFHGYVNIDEEGDTNVGFFYIPQRTKNYYEPIIMEQNMYNGIFFCKEARYPGDSGFEFDNPFGVYVSEINTIGYLKWTETEPGKRRQGKHMAGWYDRKAKKYHLFYTEHQVMQFLDKYTGLDTTAVNHCTHPKKSRKKKMHAPPPYPYEKSLENHNKWMERMRKQMDSIKKKEGMTDLFLEIENERLEGDAEDNASLVFDIMVSCDHSVYFDNCLIRLSYNTGAFGSDIKENGNIAITRAPAFNTPSYYDPDTMQADIENGLVAIPFGADFNQHPVYNRTLITPTPALLMTIALDIKNCNRNTGIEYTDISLCNIFSSYTVNPGDTLPNVHSFDTTCYRGSITGKTCVPEITGFTNNVPAGLNKTITVDGKILDPFMTIEGNYFGSQQHTGTLFFKDANQVDAYPVDEFGEPISIDNYDIDSWNDDEIILKLPSIINGLTRDQQNPVPGSGEFKVMNFAGYEHEASGLEIPYALTQVLDKDTINNSLLQKANIYLSNQNDSGGYTISFDQSVEDFSPLAKQAATRAIHDWKCATLINWEVGEDNLSNSTDDGICTISASAMGNGSILQITSPQIIKCLTYPRTFFLKKFNIEINTDINWQIDTTVEDNLRINKFDFYSTIAHELGHGHMLEHVKEGSNIMYHEGDMGYIPAEARRTV